MCTLGSTANSKSASASKERGGVAKSRKFDVFLSYAEEDEDFAEEVRTRLVRENLRVFIPSEGKGFVQTRKLGYSYGNAITN